MLARRSRTNPDEKTGLMHPDGSGVRQLTSATGGLFSMHPTWSPDRSQLLFLRGTSSPNLTNIWSINADGSQLYQVTHKPAEYGTGQDPMPLSQS